MEGLWEIGMRFYFNIPVGGYLLNFGKKRIFQLFDTLKLMNYLQIIKG